MADGGATCTSTTPIMPAVVPPVPPEHLPAPPAQAIVLPTQQIELATKPQLNWSNFKPKITGKPDNIVEAHLLRTNKWMDTHAFPECVKVQ